MRSVMSKIVQRIRAKGRGGVFTSGIFLDIGTRAAVDQTLSRLVRRGVIRRLDRGVYDYPKQHAQLGTLSPDIDGLAQAAASKTGNVAFPSGALAANILGLSTQVPAKPVYMTNGPSRAKKIAGRVITLKHARVPLFDRLSDNANLALQALSYLGKGSVDDQTIRICANRMTDRDLRDLSSVADQVPGWLSDLILKIQQAKHGYIRKQA